MADHKGTEKNRLHPRNKNRERYNLNALQQAVPELSKYVHLNKFGVESIDFSHPIAVRLLNKAILNSYYGIKHWDFPLENLCPPIPGRADYLHYIADLLAESTTDNLPKNEKITCLDVGVGASGIYPILGVVEYGWHFIASDIDKNSVDSVKNIVKNNQQLTNMIDCRWQSNPSNFFQGILSPNEKIAVTLCNPPFHESAKAAQKSAQRKVRNLTGKNVKSPRLNFSGNQNELIYPGGESQFICNMVLESQKFGKQCHWFTSLVSKQTNLPTIYQQLKFVAAKHVKTIELGTGNKSSRIVAWSFE